MMIEPSADARAFALNVRQMYLALVAEGFTEEQALGVVHVALTATLGGGK